MAVLLNVRKAGADQVAGNDPCRLTSIRSKPLQYPVNDESRRIILYDLCNNNHIQHFAFLFQLY